MSHPILLLSSRLFIYQSLTYGCWKMAPSLWVVFFTYCFIVLLVGTIFKRYLHYVLCSSDFLLACMSHSHVRESFTCNCVTDFIVSARITANRQHLQNRGSRWKAQYSRPLALTGLESSRRTLSRRPASLNSELLLNAAPSGRLDVL